MSEKILLICALVFCTLYLVMSIVLICVFAKNSAREEKSPVFDERQIFAQGKAYKAAFMTMLLYYVLYAIINGAAEIVWCDSALGAFLGVIVGVTVLAVICIFSDAYFRSEQGSAGVVTMINVLCLSLGLGLGIRHIIDGTLVENGTLTADALPLFILLMGLIIDAALIVKSRLEKRCEQECANEESQN